jgi:ABC-type transport system substrate-binding protein
VFKSVPEATTRLAMLKQGEVDVAYLLDVPLAEEVKRDPTLKMACSGDIGTFFYPWSAPLEDVRLKKG